MCAPGHTVDPCLNRPHVCSWLVAATRAPLHGNNLVFSHLPASTLSRVKSSRSCRRKRRSRQNSIASGSRESPTNGAAAAQRRAARIWRRSARPRSRARTARPRAATGARPRRRSARLSGAWRNRRRPRRRSRAPPGPRTRTWRAATSSGSTARPSRLRRELPALGAFEIGVEDEAPRVGALEQHHAHDRAARGVHGGERHGVGIDGLAFSASANQAANSAKGSWPSMVSACAGGSSCFAHCPMYVTFARFARSRACGHNEKEAPCPSHRRPI